MSKRISTAIQYWLTAGFFLFLASFFVCYSQNFQKKLFYVVLVAPTILLIFSGIYKPLFRDLLFQITLVAVVFMASTVIWSPDRSNEMIERVIRDAAYILSLVLATWLVIAHRKEPLTRLFTVICTISSIAALIIFIDFYSERGWNLERTLIPEWKFGNQNRLAKTYGMICVFGVGLFLLTENRLAKFIGIGSAVISVAIIILTKSMGGAAALAAIPLFLFRANCFRITKSHSWWAIAILATLALLVTIYHPNVWDGFFDQGWSRRDLIWPAVIQIWLEQPLIGTGILEHAAVVSLDGGQDYHEHNLVLALLRQSGMVGAALTLAIYVGILLRSYITKKKHNALVEALVIYSLLASMSGGTFPLEQLDDNWFWVWVPLSLALAIQMTDNTQYTKSRANGNIPI